MSVSISTEISEGVSDGSKVGIIFPYGDAKDDKEGAKNGCNKEIGASPKWGILGKKEESRSHEPIEFFGVISALFGMCNDRFWMNNDGKSRLLGTNREIGIFIVQEKTLVEESDDAEDWCSHQEGTS